MKYYRNATHIDLLRRDYQNEITNVKKMLETEEDLRTRALLQETLMENTIALENLEKFILDNPNIFK